MLKTITIFFEMTFMNAYKIGENSVISFIQNV